MRIFLLLCWYITFCMSRDSSVGTATCYEVEGPGIESQLRRYFPHPSRPVLRPNLPPVQWALCGFPGGKAAGAWSWPPTPSSAEVKEIVELYLYSPLGFCGLFWRDLYLYVFNIKQLYNFKILFVLLSRRVTSKQCIHINTPQQAISLPHAALQLSCNYSFSYL